jgi:rubrerythrin
MDKTPNATVEQPKTAPKVETPVKPAEESQGTNQEKAVKDRLKDTYEKFVQRLTDELKQAGKVGKKQWEDAMKSAREFIQKSKPELKRDDIEKMAETVKKDVRNALRSFRTRGEDWTKSESFLTARDKGAEFLLKAATRVKDAFEAIENNLEETLKYRQGELVGGGRFVCTACNAELTVAESGPVPACPKCGKDEFKRKS